MQDLISVVVPVYNVEKYLNRCIESILSQTYSPIEVILVDDGSTDSCPRICDEYASRYNNIHVIHQKNGGPSIARNNGITKGQGTFITFVDGDDFLHHSLIEHLKKDMDNYNVSVSLCSFCKYSENDKEPYSSSSRSNIKIMNDQDAMNMLLDKQDYCAPWAKLYDAKHFKTLRFPIGKVYEDMLTIPHIFREAKLISMNSLELYYYNQEGSSITRSIFSKKKTLDYIEASKFWEHFAREFYPGLANKARIHHLTNVLNVCIQLILQDDETKNELFDIYKNQVNDNFNYLIFSGDFRWQDKIKLICMRLGIFKIVILLKY